jgi:hypothetical protein
MAIEKNKLLLAGRELDQFERPRIEAVSLVDTV